MPARNRGKPGADSGHVSSGPVDLSPSFSFGEIEPTFKRGPKFRIAPELGRSECASKLFQRRAFDLSDSSSCHAQPFRDFAPAHPALHDAATLHLLILR